MINGKCSTWQVGRWLERHPEHTARAPDTSSLWPCEASTDGMHVEYKTKWPPEYDWQSEGSPPIRHDLTIYNERGEPVEFKQKNHRDKMKALGLHRITPLLVVRSGDHLAVNRNRLMVDAVEVELDGYLYIRERKL